MTTTAYRWQSQQTNVKEINNAAGTGLPTKFPLNLYRGDSYNWQFRLWSDTNKTQPIDLTGVIPKAEIRDEPGGRLLGTLDCTIIEPNIINMKLTATVSGKLEPTGAWDLQLTYSDGQVSTILAGPVEVTSDVTDSELVKTTVRLPLHRRR